MVQWENWQRVALRNVSNHPTARKVVFLLPKARLRTFRTLGRLVEDTSRFVGGVVGHNLNDVQPLPRKDSVQ